MATLGKTKNIFQDRLSLNAGQKYCRMLQVQGQNSFTRLAGSSLTRYIVMCPCVNFFILCIVLVSSLEASSDMTEKVLTDVKH